MYRKILVPVDGSATSLSGLREAMKIGKILGSEIRLFHLVDELVLDYSLGAGVYGSNLMEALREGGKKILDEATAAVRREGIKVSSALLESIGGSACQFIVAHAKEWGADLIVMGTHGRRGLARLAMGSDAEGVLREATLPVLLVHHVRKQVEHQAQRSAEASSPRASSAADEAYSFVAEGIRPF